MISDTQQTTDLLSRAAVHAVNHERTCQNDNYTSTHADKLLEGELVVVQIHNHGIQSKNAGRTHDAGRNKHAADLSTGGAEQIVRAGAQMA